MVFVPLRRAGLSCICAGVHVHNAPPKKAGTTDFLTPPSQAKT